MNTTKKERKDHTTREVKKYEESEQPLRIQYQNLINLDSAIKNHQVVWRKWDGSMSQKKKRKEDKRREEKMGETKRKHR